MAAKLQNDGYTLVNKTGVSFTQLISLPVSALCLGQSSVMCSQSKQAVITHRKWLNYSGKAFRLHGRETYVTLNNGGKFGAQAARLKQLTEPVHAKGFP